jgi:hypothetical protein
LTTDAHPPSFEIPPRSVQLCAPGPRS